MLINNTYAKYLGTTTRRVQQMCKNGDINGAIKEGKNWQIPETFISNDKKSLPIGISSYKEAVSNYYYVDKTLMIKDIIDNGYKVSLFTRPRRFGKTLNMDMLRTYFEQNDTTSNIYFEDKNIFKCDKKYKDHFGKYPVIYLSFKDVKCSNWEDTLTDLRRLISREFRRHYELSTSSKLLDYEKEIYLNFLTNKANNIDFANSLSELSYMLYRHYDHKIIIIIDEYDTPIQQGHLNNFYTEITDFMRKFFSCGFKDNPYLEYGFMTGILRALKESLFSGLNNIKVFSIIDDSFSQYFGFTEDEVTAMLKYYGCIDKKYEVELWYDGYNFGKTKIYNPWSILNYIAEKCTLKPYWESTSSNDLLGEIILNASSGVMEKFYKLLQGEEILMDVDTSVIYPQINNNPDVVFSFLLVTGYLSTINKDYKFEGPYKKILKIPNKEINYCFEKEIINRLNNQSTYTEIQNALFSEDLERFESELNNFMIQSLSNFDTANESFYHGMMLGLCALLNNNYKIKSNRESGFGRFDISMFSKTKLYPNFIFEFKHTKDINADLKLLANEALLQIERKKYDAEFETLSSDIIKIGIAFRGKEAFVAKKA